MKNDVWMRRNYINTGITSSKANKKRSFLQVDGVSIPRALQKAGDKASRMCRTRSLTTLLLGEAKACQELVRGGVQRGIEALPLTAPPSRLSIDSNNRKRL